MAALYGSDLKRISSWELSKHHSVPGIKKQEEGKKKVLGFQLCHLQKNELASKSIHWGNRSVSLPGKTKQKKTFTEKNNSADRHKDSISPFLRLNNSPCSAHVSSLLQSVSQPRSIAFTPFLSFSALCPFMADVISPLHQGDCWPTRDWHRLLANIRDQQTQRWPDPVIRSHCFPFSPFYISAIFKSHYCFFLHFAINFHFTFLHFCSHK